MKNSILALALLVVIVTVGETHGILLFYRTDSSRPPFLVQKFREQQKMKEQNLAAEKAEKEKLKNLELELSGNFSKYVFKTLLKSAGISLALVSKMHQMRPKLRAKEKLFLDFMLNSNRG